MESALKFRKESSPRSIEGNIEFCPGREAEEQVST